MGSREFLTVQNVFWLHNYARTDVFGSKTIKFWRGSGKSHNFEGLTILHRKLNHTWTRGADYKFILHYIRWFRGHFLTMASSSYGLCHQGFHLLSSSFHLCLAFEPVKEKCANLQTLDKHNAFQDFNQRTTQFHQGVSTLGSNHFFLIYFFFLLKNSQNHSIASSGS